MHKLGTGLGTCVHFQAVSQLGYSISFKAWTQLVHICEQVSFQLQWRRSDTLTDLHGTPCQVWLGDGLIYSADCGLADSRTRGLADSRTRGLADSRTHGLGREIISRLECFVLATVIRQDGHATAICTSCVGANNTDL